MTVAIIVAFILFLLIIVIVTIGASIIEEKEREEKERVRLNRELREDAEFFLRLKRAEQELQRKAAQECLDRKRKERKK